MLVTADPFLIVGVVLLIILLLIINIYILANYQHPDDKNQSYLAKIIIILGLQLSSLCILLIPIDVANNMGSPGCDLPINARPINIYCGGINMLNVYEALFCFVIFLLFYILPFCIFYYDDVEIDKPSKWRFCTALTYELIFAIMGAIIVIPLYIYYPTTQIPVKQYTTSITMMNYHQYNNSIGLSPYSYINQDFNISSITSIESSQNIIYNLAFPIYAIGLFGWIGWFLFSIFVGVGIVSLPFDLILEFINRPKVLSVDEYTQREVELHERSKEIMDIAVLLRKDHSELLVNREISRKERRKRVITDKLEVNKLQKMVYVLQKDTEALIACKQYLNDYNPLIPYFKLSGGILFTCVSIIWILQIILYMLTDPPILTFLNAYLISFDTFFPMFGNITYASLSLYLLFCTIKGCFKFGLQLFCFQLYPMEINKTYVSSFLFNISVILLCTIPIVQFCTIAFGGYSRDSDAYLLFNIEIKYLHFFRSFFINRVFEYFILVTILLSFIYFLIRPKVKASSPEEFKKVLHNRSRVNYSAIDTIGSKK